MTCQPRSRAHRLLTAATPAAAAALAAAATAAAATAAALLALAGCAGKEAPRGGPPPVPVLTAVAARKSVPERVRAIGRVEPIETVAVRARVGGELQRVAFREGDDVRSGQLLFEIDPRPARAALAQAEAQLARDQALLAKARADITRYGRLVEQDFVTKEQFDQVTANAAALEASVAADRAAADNARLQLAYSTITAPVAGRTGALHVKAGNLVRANDDDPLVTINQVRPIYVSFSLPAPLLGRLSGPRAEAIRVAATPPGGAPREGRLAFLDNQVDPATSTLLAKATFANQDEALWPGALVDVSLTLGELADRVVVPAAAVQTGQQGPYVFVVAEDSTVELRSVEVGLADEVEAVIEKGVDAGEKVVTDGQLRLVPGARVVEKTGLGGPEGATHP